MIEALTAEGMPAAEATRTARALQAEYDRWERQALAEHAGPGRVFTDDRVETGERCASEKRRFGFRFGRVDRPRPARKRPRLSGAILA